MNIKLIIAFVVFLGIPWNAFSQSCDEQIEEAQNYYEQGKFSDCIEVLSSCKNDPDATIRLGAHRLLALCYLEINEHEKALVSAKEILTINPTYKPSKLTDPAEFTVLLNSVVVIPKLSFGISISAGPVLTFPQITAVHSIAESTNTRYSSDGGFMFGTSASFQLDRKWGLNLDLLLIQKKYSSEYSVTGIDLSMKERNTYFSFPVSLRYQFDLDKRVLPFVHAGAYGSRMLGSSSSFFYRNTENEETFSLQDISSVNRRQKWDYGAQFGLGGLCKIGAGYLSVEANYYRSFANISNDRMRYSNPQLYNQYFFLDDDVKLHAFSLTIGFHTILNYKVLD